MPKSKDWRLAFARQAKADIDTMKKLATASVPQCHSLQFLQMACEKIAKASLCTTADPPARDHGFVAKVLPKVLFEQFSRRNTGPLHPVARLTIKQLAAEINTLSPSQQELSRPDNCEYPWADKVGTIICPMDHDFSSADPYMKQGGTLFLKLLHETIEYYSAG